MKRTAFYRAIKKLMDLGYVVREEGRAKSRRLSYRVMQEAPRVPEKELDTEPSVRLRVPENELVSAAKGTAECRKTSLTSYNTPMNTPLNGGRPATSNLLVAPQSPLERQNAAVLARVIRELEAANG